MRLFAAVWPSVDVRDRLASLPLPPSTRLRPVRNGTWHVTLAFFGEVDDDTAIDAGLAAAVASLPQVATVEVGPATQRLGRQVLCLPVGGLDEMAMAVRRETAASTGSDDARFIGHLTVARARGRSAVLAAATGVPFEASFEVRSIALVESTLGSEGPTYRDRATYALGGPQPTMGPRGQ